MAQSGKRVMITGVSRHLGGKLARRLEADPEVDYIVGGDLEEPEVDLERTEFVHADIGLTILRFANVIGSEVETTLTRYFSLPLVPSPIGYDPRLQFVHEEDAEEVLYRATREDHRGIFNVAADGVVLLSQAIRICG